MAKTDKNLSYFRDYESTHPSCTWIGRESQGTKVTLLCYRVPAFTIRSQVLGVRGRLAVDMQNAQAGCEAIARVL